MFVWYPKQREASKNDKKRQGDSKELEEVIMFYQPTKTKLHKWIRVAKSSHPKHEADSTEEYGVFAERILRKVIMFLFILEIMLMIIIGLFILWSKRFWTRRK